MSSPRVPSTLREVIGPDAASTLMSFLPPVDWARVATKDDVALLHRDVASLQRDLVLLEERMALRMETMEHKLSGALDRAISGQTRFVLATIITVMLGMAGLALV